MAQIIDQCIYKDLSFWTSQQGLSQVQIIDQRISKDLSYLTSQLDSLQVSLQTVHCGVYLFP